MTAIAESLSGGRTRIPRINGELPEGEHKGERLLPIFKGSKIPDITRDTHWVVKLHDPDNPNRSDEVVLYKKKA